MSRNLQGIVWHYFYAAEPDRVAVIGEFLYPSAINTQVGTI